MVPAHVDDDAHTLVVRADGRYEELMGHPIHALQWIIPPGDPLPDGSDFRGTTGVVPACMETGDSSVGLLLSSFHKGAMSLQWALFPSADPSIAQEVVRWLLLFEVRD